MRDRLWPRSQIFVRYLLAFLSDGRNALLRESRQHGLEVLYHHVGVPYLLDLRVAVCGVHLSRISKVSFLIVRGGRNFVASLQIDQPILIFLKRFLLSKGRDSDALRVLYFIAKFNKAPEPTLTIEDFHALDKNAGLGSPIVDEETPQDDHRQSTLGHAKRVIKNSLVCFLS